MVNAKGMGDILLLKIIYEFLRATSLKTNWVVREELSTTMGLTTSERCSITLPMVKANFIYQMEPLSNKVFGIKTS